MPTQERLLAVLRIIDKHKVGKRKAVFHDFHFVPKRIVSRGKVRMTTATYVEFTCENGHDCYMLSNTMLREQSWCRFCSYESRRPQQIWKEMLRGLK